MLDAHNGYFIDNKQWLPMNAKWDTWIKLIENFANPSSKGQTLLFKFKFELNWNWCQLKYPFRECKNQSIFKIFSKSVYKRDSSSISSSSSRKRRWRRRRRRRRWWWWWWWGWWNKLGLTGLTQIKFIEPSLSYSCLKASHSNINKKEHLIWWLMIQIQITWASLKKEMSNTYFDNGNTSSAHHQPLLLVPPLCIHLTVTSALIHPMLFKMKLERNWFLRTQKHKNRLTN